MGKIVKNTLSIGKIKNKSNNRSINEKLHVDVKNA
jgi:hypothetical protein